MAQTNLDISPYFDDFNPESDFYKVLFKPGFPVQARELTTLQSILQNQISSFGEHFFKEGSLVIPGNITYNPNYSAVSINLQQGGIDVSLYIDQLIGTVVRGELTGIRAKVVNFLLPPNEGVTSPTLFVQYINSGENEQTASFDVNEALVNEASITYGNTTISAGSVIATTVPVDATATGSAANIAEGVYFIRGTFVRVSNSTVILEPFSNRPTYRVGLQINTQIITAGQDDSLYDNAKGFNNFSAPGADRLKIQTTLIKKPINDFNDTNFIELLRVEEGELKILEEDTNYNIIRDYLAERTFDESGDYVVRGLGVSIDESLNDGIGNGGTYTANQITQGGSTPSDDLAIVKVAAGKAYVRGYDLDNPGTQNLDAPKPRTTLEVPTVSVPFEMGSQFIVNNVAGTPAIILDDDNNIIEFYNGRLDAGRNPTGELIGLGRPYNFSLEDSAYVGDSTPWNLYLFDVQFLTTLTLNSPVNGFLSPQFRIRGLSSNASGLVYGPVVAGNTVNLIEVSGEFIPNEEISVNGLTTQPYRITSIESYDASQVRSVFQDSPSVIPGLQTQFTAESLLYENVAEGFTASDGFNIDTTGRCIAPGKVFDRFRVGDIVAWQDSSPAGNGRINYNRVASIAADQLSCQLEAVEDVDGVNNGNLPATDVSNVRLRREDSRILNDENSYLYAIMEEKNLSSVNLGNSSLLFSAQINNLASNPAGQLQIQNTSIGVDNSFFVAFDQERYSIHYSDGTVESINSNQVVVNSDGTTITFNNLRTSESNITLNATAVKASIVSKAKILQRSQEFVIDKSTSSVQNTDFGLTQNDFYGLRIEDEEISLNVPDVSQVVAVYESLDSQTAVLDVLGFVLGLSLDTVSIRGENIIGSESGAVARLVSAPNESSVRIVYLGQNRFEVGERVTFVESGIETNLQQIIEGNYNDLTSSFTLDKGQREQFYDYSRIIRRKGIAAPNKKLLVIFDRFEVPSNDTGDFYTVNSYDESTYNGQVPLLQNGTVRASDTLDFRPRVVPFTSLITSPFDYSSRTFGSAGSTATLVVTPNESMTLGYNFYLGRQDRLVLNTLGEFKLVQGIPAADPELPANAEGAIEIARILYPPYLYDVDDAQIINVDNRRYTMRDIGDLEDRIENLEEITTLSLLERETESLQVVDADGNNRFKTGFFVDDFNNTDFIDYDNEDTAIDADVTRSQLVAFNEFATSPLRLQLQAGIDQNSIQLSDDLPLIDENTTKTGDLVTLDYREVRWINQPLASRIENVNPFNVILYTGEVALNPASDDFVVTRSLGNRRIDVFGNSTQDFTRTFVESIEVAQFMRERNVGFAANSLRPNTQFFPFFEGQGGVDFIPKLVQISMRSGSFQVGETVRGFNGNSQVFSGRVAVPNHKTGSFNNPTRRYLTSPYQPDQTIPDNYSASSNLLNIDIDSLADISDSRFFGLLGSNVRLVGSSSRAVADITALNLVTDTFGELLGAFFFRDPYASPAPRFRLRTGQRSFRLSSSPTDATPILGSTSVSFCETNFTSGGTIQNRRTEQVTIRDLPPPPPPVIIDQTVTNNFTEVIDRTVTVNNNFTTVRREIVERTTRVERQPIIIREADPLSQTFRVDETGAFLTSVDIYMATKSETDNLRVQIRPTQLGTPENFLLQNYAEVVLSPDEVNISDDASVPTNVVFPSPIFLEPGITYALVLEAPTTDDYNAWIARMGEQNVTGLVEEAGGAVVISQQYLNGSLFKSQNGSIWTPSQFEDLKFTLYKAQFTTTPATVFLENPPNGAITQLANNPVLTLPRKLRVPITQSGYPFDTSMKIASTTPLNPTEIEVVGDIEDLGGPVIGVDITTPGIGFVDGSYTNVPVFPLTSRGEGLQLDATIAGGEITTLTIATAGSGYRVGDTVGLQTSSVGGSGGDAVITISTIGDTDTLYLTNVDGEFINAPNIINQYLPQNSPPNDLIDTGSVGDNTSVSEAIDPYLGNVFVVDVPAHGMHQDGQLVELTGILPDTIGQPLIENLGVVGNEIIVNNPQDFNTFEGITTTTGFAYLGGEIVEYEYDGVNNTVGISSRGVDGTAIQIHDQGTLVFKYELSGVSLTRINTTHLVPAGFEDLKDFSKLVLEFNRGERATGNDQLNFNQEQQAGENAARTTQNFQYDRLLPSLGILTPGNTTTINSTIRTVTGTSAGAPQGIQQSFIDQGFEPINLNTFNTFNRPRLIASRINENEFLDAIPGNKSVTLALELSTTDVNLSPVVDINQSNLVLARFSLNNPISNYADDGRVNLVVGDPHSSIYISDRITIDNPSTGLRVILTAERDATADFRVLYRLFGPNTQGSTEPTWELFPGYNNLLDTTGDGFGDTIVDPSKNNGLPNREVRASEVGEFLEYIYEVNDITEFSGFQIKVVLAGTNEARAPKFRDIRAIALI